MQACPRCSGFIGGGYKETLSCMNCGWQVETGEDNFLQFLDELIAGNGGPRLIGTRDK